jgi:hypothetical protein
MVLSALVPALAGCAGTARQDAAESAAHAFYSAVADHSGEVACHLLAPRTREELEQSAGQPCPRAVLAEDIPTVGRDERPGRVSVYGDQAVVPFSRDTVFLAAFSSGWKVTAAGCTARGELPYDCAIKGT